MFCNLKQSSPFDGILIDDRNERPLTVALATILVVWSLAFALTFASGHRRELRILAWLPQRRSRRRRANDGLRRPACRAGWRRAARGFEITATNAWSLARRRRRFSDEQVGR